MNKLKLLISILILAASIIMTIVGIIFVSQFYGMIALIIFGSVGFMIGLAFLGMTMSDCW